jgi:hypothetical protein
LCSTRSTGWIVGSVSSAFSGGVRSITVVDALALRFANCVGASYGHAVQSTWIVPIFGDEAGVDEEDFDERHHSRPGERGEDATGRRVAEHPRESANRSADGPMVEWRRVRANPDVDATVGVLVRRSRGDRVVGSGLVGVDVCAIRCGLIVGRRSVVGCHRGLG